MLLRSVPENEISGLRTTGSPEHYTSLGPARDNLRQLVLLRAIAIAGQIITVAFVSGVLEIALPLLPLSLVIGFLAFFNLATWLHLRLRQPVSDRGLFSQILADVGAFTALLYFTGGAANPFASMYVLNIAVAAAVLPRAYTWNVTGAAVAGYLLLIFFSTPLTRANGYPVEQHLLMTGLGINFVIVGALTAFFLVKITSMLSEHVRLLARAKENELTNECIVQLGAFAAGAAHELGTPLSTMAVVAKELQVRWRKNPELLSELSVITDQIELCKDTLSTLLASAGHTRMEGCGKVALDEFLKAVVENWRLTRPQAVVTCRCHGTRPTPEIVAEQSLRQAIVNLLNNAADASPERVDVEGQWDERELCIRICDRGHGVPSEAGDKLGRVFFTTKPQGQGSGVGLVLSSAIIGRFGGSVKLSNQPECGACAEVRLPLASFLLPARP
jgi:two-component system sensor histidine kinase RegB